MTDATSTDPGDIRFTDSGEVEIFNGESWVVAGSTVDDPATGMRGDTADPEVTGPLS